MDWDKLRIFHAAAEAGSFTHASEQLNLCQTAVSRQISALEDSLGLTLFHRHARGLLLTETGEVLYGTTREVFTRLADTENRLRETKGEPSGDLKLTTTVGFGANWLVPRLKEFTDRYPKINLHLIVSDLELDLSMREADVAVRFHPPVQQDLVQRKLFRVHYHLSATRDYLARKGGEPKTLEELDNHDIVVYGDNVPAALQDVNWLERAGRGSKGPREPYFRVNNIYGVLKAVESGFGIGCLPDYIIRHHPDLTRILPEAEVPHFDTFFVYPAELRDTKRVTVMRDFLLEKVREWTY
jgi:DNA-binding transcriptional LysR family regulator